MPASRAGSRTARFRTGYGRINDNKIAFLTTQTTSQVSLHALDPGDHDEENNIEISSEMGTSYVLMMPVAGRAKPLIWNLSAMTEAELEATRQFFNYAFDLADPVTRERDKVAQDAFAEGDDSYTRVYRAVPQFIKRQRKKRQNSKGVLQRPEGPAGRDGSRLDSDGGVRGVRDELADGEPEQGGAEDDWSQAD